MALIYFVDLHYINVDELDVNGDVNGVFDGVVDGVVDGEINGDINGGCEMVSKSERVI